MKCKCRSMLLEDNPCAINDTREISAKKMLTYFLETFGTVEDLLYDSETMQAINTILQASETQNVPQKARDILEELPWTVCTCFYKFLSECPHVHVTID